MTSMVAALAKSGLAKEPIAADIEIVRRGSNWLFRAVTWAGRQWMDDKGMKHDKGQSYFPAFDGGYNKGLIQRADEAAKSGLTVSADGRKYFEGNKVEWL